MDDEIGDTIIVRPRMDPQCLNNHHEVVLHEQPQVVVTHEDCAKIQEMAALIEALKEQASFNGNWRLEAEADYIETRKKVLESEEAFSSAITNSNNAAQLASNNAERITVIHNHSVFLDERISGLSHKAEELNFSHNTTQYILAQMDQRM